MKSLITAWSIKSMTPDNKCFRRTRENGLGRVTEKQQAFSWVFKDEYDFAMGERGVGQGGDSSLSGRTLKSAGLCDCIHSVATR